MTDNTAKEQRGRPFQPGVSGNPGGRPAGSRNRATLAVQALLEGDAEAITRRVIDLAKKGDMAAIKLVLERILPPRRDIPITITLPSINSTEDITSALAVIIDSVAQGELTPSEGEALASLIDKQQKNFESSANNKDLNAFLKASFI